MAAPCAIPMEDGPSRSSAPRNSASPDLIDPNRALREATRLEYSNIQDLLDDKGRLKPAKDSPPWIAAARNVCREGERLPRG
jgi:hypothetical protein